MSHGKIFGVAPLGYNKADVNAYIEKLNQKYGQDMKRKEDELVLLRTQLELDSKLKIADVLIKAQEKADLIISDAKTKAQGESKKLNTLIEAEKCKLSQIREDIKRLKGEMSKLLKQYEIQLDDTEQKTLKVV